MRQFQNLIWTLIFVVIVGALPGCGTDSEQGEEPTSTATASDSSGAAAVEASNSEPDSNAGGADDALQKQLLLRLAELLKEREIPAGRPPRLAWAVTEQGLEVPQDGVRTRAGQVIHIDAHFTPLSDADLDLIGKVTSIETLDVDGTAISDEGLKKLTDLTALKHITVRETSISDAGIAAFREAHPDCRIDK